MREGNVRTVLEGHIADTQGDLEEAQKRTGDQVGRLIETEELKPEDVSLRSLFEGLVNYNRDVDLSSIVSVHEALSASSYPYITSKLIAQVQIKEYEMGLGDAGELVTEITSKRRNEDVIGFEESEDLEEVGESMPYEEVTMGEKRIRLTHHKFGRICSLTREMILFDQTAQLLQRARKIGKKGGTHRHRYIVEKACGLACNATGESATYNFVHNGTAAAIFSDDHSAIDEQTNDNVITTAFGFDALDALYALLMQMKDEKGTYIFVVPKQLLVPPQLKLKARKLIESPTQYDTTDRAINPLKGELKVLASPYLAASSGIYYLGDFPAQTIWSWIEKPKTESLVTTTESAIKNDILQMHRFMYFGGCASTDYRQAGKGGS